MKRFQQSWIYPVLVVPGVTFAAWLLRSHLTLANFTMIYILVVLVLAIQRGTRVALAAAGHSHKRGSEHSRVHSCAQWNSHAAGL